MDTFFSRLKIIDCRDATFFAASLFEQSFGAAFPTPRDACGLPVPTPPRSWHQYVAFYKEADGALRVVGFCNWIRNDEFYLEGGMCVDRHFYRSLSREEWQACRDAGGIAQLMMETAARELNDAAAWFGYCGDRKASIVDARVGYVPTSHPYLIVKWFQALDPTERERLIAKAASIGPF